MHPLTSYLRRLIRHKRSNLCVSADITNADEMLALARAVGPSIVVFKTHADILSGWDPDPVHGTGAKLAAIARKYLFLVFEDRKFADIGFTVQLQYAGGVHRIVDWAHIVNAHVISGPDVVRALQEAADSWGGEEINEDVGDAQESGSDTWKLPSKRGLLLLAQMTSAGNFLNEEYTSNCVAIARQYREFVMGFIALKPLNSQPEDDFIVMTPGCSLPPEESLDDSEFVPGSEDALGQQYVTPKELILRGCDIVIVGRGICNATDPSAKAEQYRGVAWQAYEERPKLESGDDI
ncbi:hypothetical protein G7Y89_g8108 [Cudoniella acicularis]|uniref:Orotidine 5'-phosphate decarboxylase n=1 Tax=Cudoniella acicularis TaxID=354080 RepID=A0A8H4RJZ3_9HELO|nr:hypothetical protein G7Y89_g8108 [Cudoniella acicularis]